MICDISTDFAFVTTTRVIDDAHFDTLFVVLFVFQGRFSLCNKPWFSWTSFVEQAGLKLTGICLPLPPKC